MQKILQSLQSYLMSNLETKKRYGLFAGAVNKKLIAGLAEKGVDVLIFPAITTIKKDLNEHWRSILLNLADYDWLVFTDVFSAAFFIESLRELEIDLFDLDSLRVCAFGEAVSDCLRFEQIHADIIPTKIETEQIFTVISAFAEDNLQGIKFLVIKETSVKPSIIERLTQAQADVEVISIYEGMFADKSEIIKLKALLKGGAVDEFIFSTAADLVSLKLLFPDEDLVSVLNEVKVSVTIETVYQALLENGLRPLYFHHQ